MKRINNIIIAINEIKLDINSNVENIEIELNKNKTSYTFNGVSKNDLIESLIDFNGLEDNTLNKIINFLDIALKGY